MWNNAMTEGGYMVCELCGDLITQLGGIYAFMGVMY